MNKKEQARSAEQFREQNLAGKLLMPNAWDPISAKIFAQAGYTAIGTTSAGVAFARGVADGEQLSRAAVMHEIAAITGAVSLPVTADIEAGYGATPADVASTIDAVLEAGAVGINLEDATSSAHLFDTQSQVERLAAARAAAQRNGIELFINARTDMFLRGIGNNDQQRLAATLERGQAYLQAGADMVFVPGVVDTQLITQLSQAFGKRLNVMAMPGAPSAAELFAAGASRISLGPFAMLGMLGRLRDIAKAMRASGTFESIETGSMGFADIMELVATAE